jgi:FkbM family methyltransferase
MVVVETTCGSRLLAAAFKKNVKRALRHFGFDFGRYREANDELRRLVNCCARREINAVLDVGANHGQFACSLREAGYRGLIVSFEPLSDAHAILVSKAQRDPLWLVAPRCAVGASPGSVQINIAGNSVSSSVLPMLDAHVRSAPESAYCGRESVNVIALDDFLANRDELLPKTLALKVDVQGYESHVLAGSEKTLDRTMVLYIEMSLTPLYEGAASFVDLFKKLELSGFTCISIVPGFTDPRTFEVLQVNAIFGRVQR